MRRDAAVERQRNLAAWLVVLVTATLVLINLVHLARYARDIPLAEDWLMVPALVGEEPSLAGWLWSQNNEHRLPLPRLVHLGLLELTAGDFRAGMVANILVLGGLGLALAWLARRLRGGDSRPQDAFFPLALLHLGHWNNLFWSWQLQYVLSLVPVCGFLALALTCRTPPGVRWSLGALAVAIALPLCGANSLLFAPALAVWLVAVGTSALRQPAGRTAARLCLVAAAIAVAGVVAYFIGFERYDWNPPSPSPRATLRTALRFAAMGLGPGAEVVRWPASVFTAAALLGSAALIVWRTLHERADRARLAGMFCFLGASGLLALAIGEGRAAQMPAGGMPDRYALLSVPALAAAWFSWQEWGGRFRAVMPALLALAIVALLPANVAAGYSWRNWYVGGMKAVELDLAAGRSLDAIAAEHRAFLMHWDQGRLLRALRLLERHDLGPVGRRCRSVPAYCDAPAGVPEPSPGS